MDDDTRARERERGARATGRNDGVDERAVTKYGSQRLVNNGALRRRGIAVADDDDDETTFYGSLRTLDPVVIASHDNGTTDTVSRATPEYSRTHHLSTSICPRSSFYRNAAKIVGDDARATARGVGFGGVGGERRRGRKRIDDAYFDRRLSSRGCFLVPARVILLRADERYGHG